MADKKRLDDLKKAGGADRGLEFWFPGDKGDPGLPRPTGTEGKYALEIYSPELMHDPEKLKAAIYGDMIHGLRNDAYFNSLRKQFTENYPPKIKKWNDDAVSSGQFERQSLDDMYIRGRLAENQGEEWKEPSRYSSKQLQILDKMRHYISTGEK